jgi:hypothetical protein
VLSATVTDTAVHGTSSALSTISTFLAENPTAVYIGVGSCLALLGGIAGSGLVWYKYVKWRPGQPLPAESAINQTARPSRRIEVGQPYISPRPTTQRASAPAAGPTEAQVEPVRRPIEEVMAARFARAEPERPIPANDEPPPGVVAQAVVTPEDVGALLQRLHGRMQEQAEGLRRLEETLQKYEDAQKAQGMMVSLSFSAWCEL